MIFQGKLLEHPYATGMFKWSTFPELILISLINNNPGFHRSDW